MNHARRPGSARHEAPEEIEHRVVFVQTRDARTPLLAGQGGADVDDGHPRTLGEIRKIRQIARQTRPGQRQKEPQRRQGNNAQSTPDIHHRPHAPPEETPAFSSRKGKSEPFAPPVRPRPRRVATRKPATAPTIADKSALLPADAAAVPSAAPAIRPSTGKP
jgi:hypothetical protein